MPPSAFALPLIFWERLLIISQDDSDPVYPERLLCLSRKFTESILRKIPVVWTSLTPPERLRDVPDPQLLVWLKQRLDMSQKASLQVGTWSTKDALVEGPYVGVNHNRRTVLETVVREGFEQQIAYLSLGMSDTTGGMNPLGALTAKFRRLVSLSLYFVPLHHILSPHTFLPKLRHLTIRGSDKGPPDLTGVYFNEYSISEFPPGAFEGLETLHMSSLQAQDLAALIEAAPNMRSLHLDVTDRRQVSASVALSHSTLQILHLYVCSQEGSSMALELNIPQLQELVLQWVDSVRFINGSGQHVRTLQTCTTTPFAPSLLHHLPSLESLNVSICGEMDGDGSAEATKAALEEVLAGNMTVARSLKSAIVIMELPLSLAGWERMEWKPWSHLDDEDTVWHELQLTGRPLGPNPFDSIPC